MRSIPLEEEKRRPTATRWWIQLNREPPRMRALAGLAYLHVYLPIVTGGSRRTPPLGYSSCSNYRTAGRVTRKKGDTVDGALAYSNLLQVRSSARRTSRLATRSTTERYNRIRDHLRRVFHSRDNLDGINSLKLCFFSAFKTFFYYYDINRIR